MVRSGDEEQPSPGGTRSSQDSPQVPAARTSRLSARRVPVQPAVPFQATLPDWDVWAARRAQMPPDAPQSSAADLRDLAEIGDLLGELAGLVRDLGALTLGLISAAADAGGRPRRAFAVPAELAELAGAHQELKAEQQALSALFESDAGDRQDRAAQDRGSPGPGSPGPGSPGPGSTARQPRRTDRAGHQGHRRRSGG